MYKMSIHMNKVSASHMNMNHTSMEVSEQRDPRELNKNVEIVFSSVVGEPESIRSPDWVWKVSHIVFTFVQSWTYKFLTVILAPLLAIIIGFHFALLIFLQIWCFRPILKFLHIIFAMVRTLGEILANGIFGPAFETLGLCLSNVKIRHQRVYDAKDEPQFPFII